MTYNKYPDVGHPHPDVKYTPGPFEPACDADRIGVKVARELLTFGLGWFVVSHSASTLKALVQDARPVDGDPSMVELAHRPVEEYGTGYGEGFTKGYELGCLGNALGNLRDAIERGQVPAADLEAAGLTVEMIDAAHVAEDRAYVLWCRVTGREVPSWRSVGTGRDFPEDIEKAAGMRGCGADPCCGKRATPAGCIFA